MADSKLNELIGTALEKVRALADTDTVIGEPYVTPNGTTIIPVSKVSMGFASGGLDYDGKVTVATGTPHFGGGGGTGISVTPIAFLLIHPEGNVELLPLSAPSDSLDKIAALMDKVPGVMERIAEVFRTKKEDKKRKKAKKDKGEIPVDDNTEAENEQAEE